MCHSRNNNNKINRLHERCLRLIYGDRQSSYEKLLEKDGSVSIHHKNIQFLAIEMFKVKMGMSPEIARDVFQQRTIPHHNFRHQSDFRIPFVRTVYYGSESTSCLGPKVWDIVPNEIKQAKSLNSFKEAIKKWRPQNCPCRLCKVYLNGVGFL